MRLAAGLCQDRLGELQRFPRPPDSYKGEGTEGRERKGLGMERGKKGREGH